MPLFQRQRVFERWKNLIARWKKSENIRESEESQSVGNESDQK